MASIQTSLIVAAQVYQALTGRDAQAVDISIDFALLPVNALVKPDTPLEHQPQLAGDGKVVVIKADLVAPLLRATKP